MVVVSRFATYVVVGFDSNMYQVFLDTLPYSSTLVRRSLPVSGFGAKYGVSVDRLTDFGSSICAIRSREVVDVDAEDFHQGYIGISYQVFLQTLCQWIVICELVVPKLSRLLVRSHIQKISEMLSLLLDSIFCIKFEK